MSVQLIGFDEFIADLDKMASDKDTKTILNKASNGMYDAAKSNAPVLTGFMQKTVRRKVNNDEASIYVSAWDAIIKMAC